MIAFCNVCRHEWKFFTYTCDHCQFNVCVLCASEQRLLHHPGHQEHTLTLIKREALFHCDACAEDDKDSSYICTTCDFWIHKKCAFSPFLIPSPTYHHHPLNLIYSILDNHRYFERFCGICKKLVPVICWMYYCHKCTYFVHISCSTSTVCMVNEIEDGINNEPDLVQFPLQGEESLLDLIMVQCSKLQVNFQGEAKNSTSTSTMLDDPHIIRKHWSHRKHPLEQLQYTTSENDDDSYDNRGVLICDGCIQPITVSHPSYYACMKCGFYLHSFCATKLPQELLPGESPFHPQHTLLLAYTFRFYEFERCDICGYLTNGFYYHCKACKIVIDIRCVFLPTRIKHKSHKHSLVQRPSSNSMCSVSNTQITHRGMEYACETCSSFKISMLCAFYPSRMKHGYDDHPLTLRQPPFFYEGVFYCEICEEQVNNQVWLYHCSESCDHSFHYDCLRWVESIKLGRTYEIKFDNVKHKVRLVLKRPIRKNFPQLICEDCKQESDYFLECDGCGISACNKCYWFKKRSGLTYTVRRRGFFRFREYPD